MLTQLLKQEGGQIHVHMRWKSRYLKGSQREISSERRIYSLEDLYQIHITYSDLYDRLGSVVALANADGDIVERYYYEAYG